MPKIQNSSNIAQVEYEEELQYLFVTFHTGRTYRYSEVPIGIYDKMLLAKSIGSFFNVFIKEAGYPCIEITPVSVVTEQEIPSITELKSVISKLEKLGFAKTEMDEQGNARIIIQGEMAKQLLN